MVEGKTCRNEGGKIFQENRISAVTRLFCFGGLKPYLSSWKSIQMDLLRQPKGLPCAERATLALRRFSVCEDDWGSEKPVEAAREFAAEFGEALAKI